MQIIISQKPHFDEILDGTVVKSEMSIETQMEYIWRVFGAIVKNDVNKLPKEINQVFCRYAHSYTKDVFIEAEISITPKVTLHSANEYPLVMSMLVFFSQESFMDCDEMAKSISAEMTIQQAVAIWNYIFPSNTAKISEDTPLLKFPILIEAPKSLVNLGDAMMIHKDDFSEKMEQLTSVLKMLFHVDKSILHWEIVEGPMNFKTEMSVQAEILNIYFTNRV